MILITEAITANMLSVMVQLAILCNYRKKRMQHNEVYHAFFQMLAINAVLCVVETISFMIDGVNYPFSRAWNMGINAFLFACCVTFSKLWINFNYIRIFGKAHYKRDKSFRWLSSIPMLIVFCLIIINFFTPILFEVDPETLLYHRRDGFAVCYAVVYFYLITGIFMTYRFRQKARNYVLGSVILFLIPVIVGSIIQYMVQGISTIWVGTTIGMLMLYFSLQDEHALIDELSGVYSRRYMNSCLLTYLEHSDEQTKLAGIMLDIDRFKTINDVHGHYTGDEAIRAMGQILRHATDVDNSIAARYGGDEFVIMAMIHTEDDITAIINNVQENLIAFNKQSSFPFTLTVSIGYTVYQKKDTYDTFIKRMDEAMYRQKKRNAI